MEKGILKDEEEILVIVDDRELKSSVSKRLFKLGARLESRRLEVGDYIVSDRTCIERKSLKDFVGSIVDGRLFSQARDLACFEIPVMIVEGPGDLYSQRNMHPNSITGAMSSVILDYRIIIIRTNDESDSARLIFHLAKREQKKGQNMPVLRKSTPLTTKERQEFIVSGLPGVGPNLAKNLLKDFGSVERVFSADFEELKNVKKIGDKKAREIRELIKSEY